MMLQTAFIVLFGQEEALSAQEQTQPELAE